MIDFVNYATKSFPANYNTKLSFSGSGTQFLNLYDERGQLLWKVLQRQTQLIVLPVGHILTIKLISTTGPSESCRLRVSKTGEWRLVGTCALKITLPKKANAGTLVVM